MDTEKLIMVENNKNLGRDPSTGALININSSEIKQARNAKMIRLAKDARLNQLENDVYELKNLVKRMVEHE